MAHQHAPERSNAAAWWQAVRGLRRETWGDALAGYMFVGPAVLLFFTFNAYPVLRGLMIAFSDYRYLLRTAKWAIPVLAIVAAWKTMGTNVLLLLVGLYNINQELYEAASIDGAGWWRRLFHITIPLLRPTFTIIFVLAAGVLGGGVEESLVFFGVTDAGPEGAGRVIGRYAYEVAFREGDLRWGYAAAMNLTVGLMSMPISAGVFRALRSGRV